jgi:hypothetical protein
VLPLPPLNIHPAKTTRQKGGVSSWFNQLFHRAGGTHGLSRRQSRVLTGCRGNNRGYPRVALALRAGIRGLSLDSPRFPRADFFEVDAHPQTQKQTTIEVLKCKIREFVLTWSKQKSVSSTVAPGITMFGKGGLLAPESISKSAMVIMSCQLLFIDFLASFCHFFGPLYQFLYTKNHFEWFRSYMGGI